MSDRSQQLLVLNFAMICIATSGAFGRSLSIGPEMAIWWRSIIGFIALWAYTRYSGLSWQLPKGRSRWMVLLSGILMTGHWVAYFYALKWSNVATAMVAVFTYPAITTLLEPLFLKTRFQPIHLLLGTLMLLGIYFMAPDFSLKDNYTIGIIAGVVSATIYALRNILMKTQVGSINGSVLMGYQVGIAVLVLFPLFLAAPKLPLANDWLPLFGLGLITTALGHTLFLRSFQHFSVSTASLMSSIQPVYGILFGFLMLGEVPSWSAIGGGILILSTVLIEALRTR